MWRIEDKLSGAGETPKLDKYDDVVGYMRSQCSENHPLCLWWVYGGHNVKVCEVSRLSPVPSVDYGKLCDLGWSNSGEYKCPLCGTTFGKNLNGDKPFALVSKHRRKHFHIGG